MCIEMLIDHVSRGGNLLMNVGPTSRGYFDYRAVNCLDAYAEWMKYNSRSIYGCGAAPFKEPSGCRYTFNPKTNRLYVHIYSWPFHHIHLPDMAGKVKYAQILEDGSEILFSEKAESCVRNSTPVGNLTLNIPDLAPRGLVPVIELFLK